MMIEYFVEVPNKGIQEPEFGFAEVCWYALNGKRVSEGGYSEDCR